MCPADIDGEPYPCTVGPVPLKLPILNHLNEQVQIDVELFFCDEPVNEIVSTIETFREISPLCLALL